MEGADGEVAVVKLVLPVDRHGQHGQKRGRHTVPSSANIVRKHEGTGRDATRPET